MPLSPPNETQYRALEIRAADTEAREITGIGVPFDSPIQLWWGREEFAPGSVDATGARAVWQHGEVIGVITSHRETEAGLEVTAKISKTARGDEALELVKDGAIRNFSIGFIPDEYEVKTDENGDTVRHTKVRALEFSLVTFPAYDAAEITSIRSKETNPVTATAPATDVLTRADLDPINDALDVMKREMATINSAPATPAVPEFRSMGHFVKALAQGNEEAQAFYRDFTGGKIAHADLSATWLGSFIKLATERRRYVNMFSTAALPADGMTVEFGKLKANTMKVATQAKEGDELVNGKIELTRASEPIITKGGYFEVSQQVIDRSTPEYLNTSYEALALAYARDTNNYVKTRVKKAITDKLTAATPGTFTTVADTSSATQWNSAILAAAAIYEDNGYNPEGLIMSADIFETLANMTDGNGRPLMNVFGSGVNVFGEMNLPTGAGNLAGVKVNVIHGETGLASFYDPLAFKTLESGPFRLQDDNIINLTQAFSLYGYISHIAPHPDALVPVKIGS
ncbi:HK97 family phage prohead protease [Rothia sp. L_38]|uniref:HK97 family phage prohead protease n=1 Tax=Rothia sp. L_38 TaxID=3422315 RepID=UPI003D6B0E48